MRPLSPEDKIRKLERENIRLKAELSALRTANKVSSRLKIWMARQTTNLIIGRGLKKSILRLYNELPNRVTKDTFADLSSHLVWRITRIGVFAIMAALVPLLVLAVQTMILGIQNVKIENQNELILNQNRLLDHQIHLDESTRRSSFIFLMSNIMDKVDEELKDKNNTNRKLTRELIGRIVSLSQALRPYRYLEEGDLTRQELSPERGQLLYALVNSQLDEGTYDTIFSLANFSYADLREPNFAGAYLRGGNFANSRLPNANFSGAELESVNFKGAILEGANFENSLMEGINLEGANLRGAEMVNVNARYANLYRADMSETFLNGDFSGINLEGVRLHNATLGFVLLDNAWCENADWIDSIAHYRLEGTEALFKRYLATKVAAKEVIYNKAIDVDSIWVMRTIETANFSLMEKCDKIVLEIIQSSRPVRKLIRKSKILGEKLNYYSESNPFGSADLHINKDTVYQIRIGSEKDNPLNSLMWLQFDPHRQVLSEMIYLPDTVIHKRLEYNKILLQKLTDSCINP